MIMRERLLRADYIILFVFGLLCFAVLMFNIYTNTFDSTDVYLLMVVLGILIWVPLFYYMRNLKIYRSSKYIAPQLFFEFTADYILIKVSQTETKIGWQDIIKVSEQPIGYMLYNTGYSYVPVFKHWFTTQQLTEFTTFLKEKKLLK